MGQNVFEMLGVEGRELSYSNFLAWLMDPSLNGKVGDEFLRRFLELKELKLGKIEYDLTEDSIEVSREDSKSESEADIVVMNDEFQLVIENKVKSKEGKKQTPRLYEDWCGSDKDEIFVYLTPEYREDCECNDEEEFEHITYTQIRDILENMEKSDFEMKTKTMIKDFKETLEVNNLVEFEGFSEESKEYIEDIKEIKKKESKWKEESEQFFNEIKKKLEGELDNEWEIETGKTNVKITKDEKSWKNIHYSCAINESHLKDHNIRVKISVKNDLNNRGEKYENFLENFDVGDNKSTEASWIRKYYEKEFKRLKNNDLDSLEEIVDEIFDLIKETEKPIEKALKE